MELWDRLGVVLALGVAVWTVAVLTRKYFEAAEVPPRFERRDADIDRAGPFLVEFSSPYCYDCKQAVPLLEAAAATHAAPLAIIDAKQRPDLAAKYGIRRTPTILVVDAGGVIREGWLGTPSPAELDAALSAVSIPKVSSS